MRCKECESQISDSDVFCPYCGISLSESAEPPPPADDQMASTIVMPFAAKDESSEFPTPTTQPERPASAELPEPAPIEVPVSPTGSSSEEAPEPQFVDSMPPTEPDIAIDDIPPPAILSDQLSFQKPEPAPALPDSSEPTAGPDLPQPPPDILARPIEVETPVAAAPVEQHPAYPGGTEPSDPEIGRPEESLETPDPYASPSVFDSVRIMEPNAGQQDLIETRLGPGSMRPSTDLKPQTSGISPEENSLTGDARPYTAPNIGIGDTDGKRSAKLKPLAEGTVLNKRYEIVRKIGGGGMGAVYLASDNNLGGVLRAVKEMVQAHIEEEQQDKAINDFKRESMILSTLDHPSIPTIFDYFYDQEEGRFYLVMKYISGGDLAARLRAAPEGKIDEKTVIEWGIQIADVLDYLHNQPSTIVYRDLKPSNIMIDGNTGRIMLIDFGIARSIGQKQEKGVTAVGTMGYAPPELFSGNVEPRSDIYSLGSTMFHLLTGADPQSNPLLIFDFQKNPRPRQINSRLSDQMERILMRSVEYNADARFLSAAEMKQVLEDHLAKLKAGTLTYGVTEVPASVGLADQTVFCGFCGQRIVATDLFCAFCGAKQPIAQQGVHSEIYIKPQATAKLLVEGTNDLAAPTFSLLKDDNLLGRRDPMSNIFPEVDLSKYDPQTKISRRHARIRREGGSFVLEDLGSSNGTVLARSLKEAFRVLPHQPQMLSNGDKIKLGDTTLHFVVG